MIFSCVLAVTLEVQVKGIVCTICWLLRIRRVDDAAGGNLLTFMISELNRAAERKIDEEGE